MSSPKAKRRSDNVEPRAVLFGEAYLSGWFSNLQCPCGERYGPDDLLKAKQHFEAGHYTAASREDK